MMIAERRDLRLQNEMGQNTTSSIVIDSAIEQNSSLVTELFTKPDRSSLVTHQTDHRPRHSATFTKRPAFINDSEQIFNRDLIGLQFSPQTLSEIHQI